MLQTDASDRGVGAVLSQLSDDGEEHPMHGLLQQEVGAEGGTLLNRRERMFGYTVGSGGFQSLFTGTQVCYSDGPSFARVVGASERRKSKAMQMELGVAAVYEYTVEHRAGTANLNADALSRATKEFVAGEG